VPSRRTCIYTFNFAMLGMSRKVFWSKRATRRRKLAYAFMLSNVKLFLLNFKSSVFEESRDPRAHRWNFPSCLIVQTVSAQVSLVCLDLNCWVIILYFFLDFVFRDIAGL
jgi:hypothetical protein